MPCDIPYMRFAVPEIPVFLFSLALAAAGCRLLPEPAPPQPVQTEIVDVSGCTLYAPAKIDILPLTEFASVAAGALNGKINLYVALLDSFGVQMKSPGVFRFELYELIYRSAQPKGRRIFFWPEADLNDPVANNNCWRDFLRAYEFSLDLETAADQNCVLQVTFLSADGKRLSAEYRLKPAQ